MPRGQRIERVCDRAEACANCGMLRFLKFREMTRHGITGFWFCRVSYEETGAFDSQPWDFHCDDFTTRGRRHDKNKMLDLDSVPIVEAQKEWEHELVS